MAVRRKKRKPERSRRKLVLWSVAFLLGLPIVAFLSLVLVNVNDEPLVVRDIKSPSSPAAFDPGSNAYYAALGAGAQPDENPWQAGRVYLDALWAGHAKPMREYPRPPAALRFTRLADLPCRDEESDCLAEAPSQKRLILEIAKANRIRQDRYESLRHYSNFQEQRPQVFGLDPPDISFVGEHRLVLCQASIDFQSGQKDKALRRLSEDIVFWRKVASGSTTLVTKLTAFRRLETDYRLLSGMLAKIHTSPLLHETRFGNNALSRALEPLESNQTSLSEPLRGEHAQFSEFFSTLSADRLPQPLFGMEPAWVDRVLLSLFFNRHATLNLLERRYDALVRLTHSRPHNFLERVAETIQRDSEWINIFQFSTLYNPIGKTMVAISSEPTWSYARFVGMGHNLTGLVRLVRLQVEIGRDQIIRAAIPAYLAGRDLLLNPFTDAPMNWNAETGVVSFLGVNPESQTVTLDRRYSVVLPP